MREPDFVFDRRVMPEPNTGCWLWIGTVNALGYGRLWDGETKRQVAAHRYSYELRKGPIPEGLVLDHLCRQPGCVNPDHLEPVTQRENTIRGFKSRDAFRTGRSFCKYGHALTPETIYKERGCDECKICRRIAKLKWRAAQVSNAYQREYMRMYRARLKARSAAPAAGG